MVTEILEYIEERLEQADNQMARVSLTAMAFMLTALHDKEKPSVIVENIMTENDNLTEEEHYELINLLEFLVERGY